MLRALLALCSAAALSGAPPARPRLLVLTDIGGDPDDQQSMVRLMAFSNEFEIEGLIASASGTPGELKGAVVRPDLIREIVAAYGKVQPNFARHARGYASGSALLRVIKSGSPQRGMAFVGADRDTEASRWIVAAGDRPDPRPLNIVIWGGAHDLAQALWRVRHDRGPSGVGRFTARLRVYSIGHQDETGPWIVENFPTLFFILGAADPGDVLGKSRSKVDRRLAVYRGMYLGGDESLTSREWIESNVRSRGPLGALYPVKTWTAPNPHGAMKEGDTPSWFYFLPNGLSDPEHPEMGNWGGRFRLVRDRYYNDAREPDPRITVSRWRPAFQNEFAARMQWSIEPDRRRANHPPAAVLNGGRTRNVLTMVPAAGSGVRLSAEGSSDPDGDTLSYRWFQYPEGVDLGSSVSVELRPKREVQVVLEVRDSGNPPLTAYRRAILRPQPSRK